MKKNLFVALSLLLSATAVNAENLFTGEHAVTWENTLKLEAEKFANAKIGDEMVVTMAAGATDVMEMKADGQWLPGSTFNWLDGKTEVKAVLTQAMCAKLQDYGLELCGPSFTVTSVDLNPDFMAVPEGAIWSGYFWIDGGWNTIELYKTAFDGQNPDTITINFSDEAEGSNFILNVLTRWDDESMKISSPETMTISGKQAVIDLSKLPEGRTLESYFEGENCLKIQGHVEEGNSFNITSVVISPYQPFSGIDTIENNCPANVDVYSITGVKVKAGINAAHATDGLPSGLYIVGNKKVIVL